MTEKVSFTRYENVIFPGFRQKINKAESVEDVRNSFVFSTKELLRNAFEGKMNFEDDDIRLLPDSKYRFVLSNRLLASPTFKALWQQSDLPRMIDRFADLAIGRYKHLQKHLEKRDAKIRM